MSLIAYKVIHVTGIFLLYMALGAVALASSEGLWRDKTAARKATGIAHGAALVLILVSGFGLLAKLGLGGGWPTWVWAKIAIWLVMGASTAIIHRLGWGLKIALLVLPLVGTLAAYLALYKPGV